MMKKLLISLFLFMTFSYSQSVTPANLPFYIGDLYYIKMHIDSILVADSSSIYIEGFVIIDTSLVAYLNQDETIAGNWINTNNPWVDNEVANDITVTNYTLLSAVGDTVTIIVDSTYIDGKNFLPDTQFNTHEASATIHHTATVSGDIDHDLITGVSTSDHHTQTVDTNLDSTGVDALNFVPDLELATFKPTIRDTIILVVDSTFVDGLNFVPDNEKFTNSDESDPLALLTASTDNVKDTHIDWGTGANQVSAVDVLIADVGAKITATEVEGALQENRTAIDLNTAKVTNTDDQKIDVFSGSGNTISISLEADGEANKTLDISGFTAIADNTAKVTTQWTTTGSDIYYNAGKVGIGTDSPDEKLHLYDAADVSVRLFLERSSNTKEITIQYIPEGVFTPANSKWYLGMTSNDNGYAIGTWDGSATQVRLYIENDTGNVGINTSTPTEQLHVIGNIAVSGTVDGIDVGIDVAANTSKVTMTYPGAGIALSTGSAWGASITNSSANWNTAYTDRLKWDGGTTGLNAGTGRTSLGGTTIGQSIFTKTNPSAITFGRANVNNTFDWLSDANFRTAINVDVAGTDNSTDVTLNASATTGGMSIAAQEISNRAATNAQTGYMTAALVTNIETNNSKVTDDDVGVAEVYNITNWNADTASPQKNDLRDYFVLFDTDGDGDLDNFDATNLASAIVELDPNVDTEAEIEAITGAFFGTSKAVTAGYIWVADGTDFESVIMSGEATIASGGAITLDNDALDDQYYDSESDLTTLLDDNYEAELNNSAGLLAALNDETGNLLSVFSGSPTFTTDIEVNRDNILTTQSDGYGLLLSNTTAATVTNKIQYSPPTIWQGYGWKTDATAASQKVEFRTYVKPVEGTSAPTGNWVLESSINDGAYSNLMTVKSSGNVGIGTDTPQDILSVSDGTYGVINFRTVWGGSWATSYGSIDAKRLATSDPLLLILNPSGGKVGIGTLTPLSKLSIDGGLHVGGDSDAGDNNLLVDGNITVVGTVDGIDIATDVGANTTHRGLTNDPHSVTAAQVGLGNVDNLSNANQVSTGALNSGSITSGFGAINIGDSNFTTTGTVTANKFESNTISMPAFSVRQVAGGQAISDVTATKLDWATEDWDTHADFNLTDEKFTPSIAGYYFITAGLMLKAGTMDAGDWFILSVKKNNVAITGGYNIQKFESTSEFYHATVNMLVYLNGTTDYVDVEVYGNLGVAFNTYDTNNYRYTYFQGYGIL